MLKPDSAIQIRGERDIYIDGGSQGGQRPGKHNLSVPVSQKDIIAAGGSHISFQDHKGIAGQMSSRGSNFTNNDNLFGVSMKQRSKRKSSLPMIKMNNRQKSLSLLIEENITPKQGDSPANRARFQSRNLSFANPSSSPMSVVPKSNNFLSPRIGSILNSARKEASQIELEKTISGKSKTGGFGDISQQNLSVTLDA